jgi:steroid 5-alpha reductase family enzyme
MMHAGYPFIQSTTMNQEIWTQVPPIWHYPATFCSFATAATYLISLLTGNVSQVDRVWTFLPNIYIAYFALLPLWPIESTRMFGVPLIPYTPKEVDVGLRRDYHPRALVMLVLVVRIARVLCAYMTNYVFSKTLWMSRLSYNTWRRGLFNLRDEDYRWAVLRAKVSPFIFQVLNLTFIGKFN